MRVNCNLCQSDDYTLLFKIGDFDSPFFIVKCNKCGFIYQNPQLGKEYLKSIYNQDYFLGKGKINYKGDFAKDRLIANERLKIIEGIKRPSRILDVGCHLGAFLEVAQKRGWDAYGIDISEFAVEVARKISGIKFFLGELKDIHFEDCFFDLITCSEVIEHLTSPYETLIKIHRILKDDGLLVIQTANMNSLRIRFLGRRDYYLPVHLYYFSKDTISKMLEKTGFEVVKVFNGSEFNISAEFKLFKDSVSILRLLLRKLLSKVEFKGFTLNTTMVVYAKKVNIGR